MTILKWLAYLVVALIVLMIGYRLYIEYRGNPNVMADIRTNPQGERAARAMIVTLPDGREYPVNYLREDNLVFMGIDGRWWRDLVAGPEIKMEIQGETLVGTTRVVLDDQAYVDDVFARLRPTAPEWLPDWLNGKLVVITLNE